MYKAIYLDASIFFHCGFDWRNGPLADLLVEASCRRIEIWSSDIAYTELQVAIRERFAAVRTAIERVERIAANLSRQPLPDVARLQELERLALDDLRLLFTSESIRILSTEDLDETDTMEVFSDYFNSRGCFSANKRSEFPDAFQAALIRRSVRTSERVAVLSSDKDFVLAFTSVDQVEVISTVERLLKELVATPIPDSIDTDELNPVESEPKIAGLDRLVVERILYDYESAKDVASGLQYDEIEIDESQIWSVLSNLARLGYVLPYTYDRLAKKYVHCQLPASLDSGVVFQCSAHGKRVFRE
jgi:hypothetical protein